jgi:hypothetical protein
MKKNSRDDSFFPGSLDLFFLMLHNACQQISERDPAFIRRKVDSIFRWSEFRTKQQLPSAVELFIDE